MQNNNNNNNNPPQQDRLTRFLRLNPPTFSSSTEPIVADDWLRTINKKLNTIQADGAERVRFAAHQLEGSAAEWWDNYQVTYPDINAITWNQFEEAFRTAHVAAGAISLKRREFRDLRQGARTVSEYGDLFNSLARYAPDDVSTDAKRREEFMRGLNDEISIQLVAIRFNNYQELVDKAVMVEAKQKSIENRKRKSTFHKHNNSVPYQKQRTSSPPPHHHNGSSASRHNGHNHNGHRHHNGNNHNGHKHRNGNGGNGNNGNHQKDISQVTCFKCRKTGHFANECPERLKIDNGNGNGNGNGKKPNPFVKATLNHVSVEEAYEAPDSVIGKFKLNSIPAVVLFDTGASHSFISRVFVDRSNIPIETINTPIRISSPGGDLVSKFGCHGLSLKIGAYSFPTSLIILESKGLDIILGMDWMTAYEGIIDCAKRVVTLTTPEKKRIRFKSNFELKGSMVNSLKGVSIEGVPVVQEFPDVFPEELPGMPPDRDIDFLIDLMPGTGPIAKRPYKMDVEELK
jgi:hypothetical protein